MLSIEATRILLGMVLLAFGRRLFWLFVGAVGFVAGARFADRFLPGQTEDVYVIFCLIVGAVSAVLAVTLRKIALGVAGFLAGGRRPRPRSPPRHAGRRSRPARPAVRQRRRPPA